MFSGIVEEIGLIRGTERRQGSVIFLISSKRAAQGLRTDDSVSVQGVCLTVIEKLRSAFRVQAVEETLRKTNLGGFRVGDRVNLERSLQMGDRIGGHFVLGHVDCVGKMTKVERRKSSRMFWISYPASYRKYLIPVGSVSVDGVSLTVAGLRGSEFSVSIIPHTLKLTTFGTLEEGQKVNLEFDVIGKYVVGLFRGKKKK